MKNEIFNSSTIEQRNDLLTDEFIIANHLGQSNDPNHYRIQFNASSRVATALGITAAKVARFVVSKTT